jgi:sugar phosphate isomerase/epimerase
MPAMRISVCSIAWRDGSGYGQQAPITPFAELLPRIRSWGYDGVELWWPHIEGLDAAGLTGLRDMLRSAGLAVPMISAYYDFTGTPAAAARSLALGHRVMAAARLLGAPAIRIFTGKKRSTGADAGEWRQCCAALRELASAGRNPAAQGGGVALAAEIHDWNLMDSINGCERLIQQVDHPGFGFIFHPSLFAPDPVPALHRLRPAVRHVHAINGAGGLADGPVDWKRLIRAFRAVDYRGYLSVEWFGPDADMVAAREAAFLRAALA